MKKLVFSIIISLFFHSVSPIALAFSPYSNQELDEIEKEFVAQINHASNVVRDPLVNQYINQLGQRLSAQSDITPKPSFFVVDSDEINAFAGPGGHIGINTMLILISEHESELAAVMAHEIAHVRQHHLYRMLEHQKHMQAPMLASILAGIALGVINPALGQGAVMAVLGGFTQDTINFIRSNEKEADRIGIDMLKNAGFNPSGMIDFFKRMQEATRYRSGKLPEILRTHPLDDNRIAEAESRSLDYHGEVKPDSLSYQLSKARIQSLTTNQPKRLLDTYQSHCPNMETADSACLYGKALVFLQMNQAKEAYQILTTLAAESYDNLFYNISLAQAETKLKKNDEAIARLNALLHNHPEDYAVMVSLASTYSATNQTDKAAYTLLKAHRKYSKDLFICHKLARAQSENHDKAYAYFTLAECNMLEANTKEARRLLKLSKSLAKKDKYLTARIDAKLDELD